MRRGHEKQRLVCMTTALFLGVVTLLFHIQTTRADIPMSQLKARCTDDRRIELVFEFSFKGNALEDCDLNVTRSPYEGTSEDGVEIHNGVVGLREKECECVLLPNGPTPTEDATGRPCEQYGDGYYDTSSSCPDGYICSCDFICNPVYDTPPSGYFYWEVKTNDGYWPARDGFRGEIDWDNGECLGQEPETWLDAGVSDAGASDPMDAGASDPMDPDSSTGCGCSATGEVGAHLLMLLVFFLCAFIPWRLARRNPPTP